jgi:hypothetical protein
VAPALLLTAPPRAAEFPKGKSTTQSRDAASPQPLGARVVSHAARAVRLWLVVSHRLRSWQPAGLGRPGFPRCPSPEKTPPTTCPLLLEGNAWGGSLSCALLFSNISVSTANWTPQGRTPPDSE